MAETRHNLEGKELTACRTTEPDLIIWRNFGLSDLEKSFRMLLVYLLACVLLTLNFIIIINVENRAAIATLKSPTLDCTKF